MLDRRHYTGRPELADLFFELQTYSEKCQHASVPPSGRWMIHLAHRRFYFDQARGTMFTEQHIYQLQLEGFSHGQVQSFYQRVNYARQALPLADQPDDFKLGHWLFLKIRTARFLEHEVRAYKRSKASSKFRRFSYLWGKIREWLQEHLEDANAAKIADTLNKFKPQQQRQPPPSFRGKAGGAVALDGTGLEELGESAAADLAEAGQDARDPGKAPAAPAKAAPKKRVRLRKKTKETAGNKDTANLT